MGPSTFANCGLKRIAMTHKKPTSTPPKVQRGNCGTWPSLTVTALQPTAAAAIINTNNTPVAVAVPLTVMVWAFQSLVGPSVTGAEPYAWPEPARVCAAGAAHPADVAPA